MAAFRTPSAVSVIVEYKIQCLLNKGFTRKELEEALAPFVPTSNDGLSVIACEWTEFYHRVFGLKVNLSKVAITLEEPGFGWVVMVPQGLTLNQVLAKCKELFPTYSYLGDDLDKVVTKSDRSSRKAYTKRFRNRVEADEELKNLSVNQCVAQGIQGITLLERLLLELWYFFQTDGGHLDLQNATLCAGSRNDDGYVPRVDWSDEGLGVGCCNPDGGGGTLRTRAAV